MGNLIAANSHYTQGRFEEGKAAYLGAVADEPSNTEALERLGTIALLENRLRVGTLLQAR